MEFAPHITLTNADFRFIIAEQLQAVGIDPGPILIEPEVKNTAAEFLQPAFYECPKYRCSFTCSTADHLIPDTYAFLEAIAVGLS